MKNSVLNRYSCRKFSGEKLDDKIVREIIDLARLSPSSCGLEPWIFLVISKDDELKNLGEICNNQPQVSNCSHAVIVMARNDLKVGCDYLDKCVKRRANTPEKYENAMKYFDNKFKNLNADEVMNYASKQCYIATANLVNLAQSFDVKSCIIAGFDKDKLNQLIKNYKFDENIAKNLLANGKKLSKNGEVCEKKSKDNFLDDRFAPILVVTLGKGEDIKFPHTRHALSDILIWN